MLRSPLQNQLRQQLSYLYGDDFQSFIIQLMFFIHGTDDFNTIRPRHDKGADGILIKKQAVLACWGPESKPSSKLQKAFEKKVKADYDSYSEFWEVIYPNWIVVINHEPAPAQIKFVSDLKPGSPIWGLNELINLINNELVSAKRRKVFHLLGISKEYISQDILDGLLEDMLQAADSAATIDYQKSPLYIPEKISLNFNEYDIGSVEDEFYALEEEYFSAIHSALSAFDDQELTKIKRRILTDFNMSSGAFFSEKFNNLTLYYLNKYASDSDNEFRDLIRGLLFWIFEQCLIGKKTATEIEMEASS